jgi:hypothetical protein
MYINTTRYCIVRMSDKEVAPAKSPTLPEPGPQGVSPMDVVSVARTTEMVACFRHEDEECPVATDLATGPASCAPVAESQPRRSSWLTPQGAGKRRGSCRCTVRAAIPALQGRGWASCWTSSCRRGGLAGVLGSGFFVPEPMQLDGWTQANRYLLRIVRG